ncbi:MAG: hypothetical protein FJ087_18840, partial [Deltaproteobacteria bacterium]|nr:hypothetical protein [Deltaproteobacteria bacterium]
MRFRILGAAVMAAAMLVAAPASAQRTDTPQDRVPEIQGAGVKKQDPAAKTGSIVVTDPGDQEKVADEGGQIYVTRGYKGVVPGVRDASPVPSKAGTVPEEPPAPPVVEWIGFQPFATYSRVFVQVDGKYGFTVVRTKPELIEVRVPGATLCST